MCADESSLGNLQRAFRGELRQSLVLQCTLMKKHVVSIIRPRVPSNGHSGNSRSARNNWLERSGVRFDVHNSCLPSGENTGKTSAAG